MKENQVLLAAILLAKCHVNQLNDYRNSNIFRKRKVLLAISK